MSAVINLAGGMPEDENLIAANIRKGVEIYDVTGTMPPHVALTEAQYQALTTKDPDTLYCIV